MRDSATPTRDVPLRRLAILGLVLVAGILSCSKDLTGPGSGRFARGLSWNAIFPQVLRSVGGLSSGVVNFTTVHVVLHHSDGTVALDTVVTYPSTADSITVSLSVRLLSDAPSSGEPMTVDLGYLDAAGDTVFKGGPISLVAAPAPPGGGANPPVQVPVAYTGPGASATSVAIAPKTDTVVAGATFKLSAVAKDAGGNALPGTPIAWTSLDTSFATITKPDSGNGIARAVRGTARILAQLLTGPMDTAKVVVTLPASQVVKPATASGDAQTGTAGVALTQPIVAMVAASDGIGVAGTTVTFAVASGGGSVSPTTAVSDANGLAQTTWTLGTGVGAQSITAAAGTLANSPLTYTATSTAGAATKLLVTTQPASTTAGSPLTLAVTAQDAHGNVATGFTGAVTLALGNTTTGAVLGGTVTVNAVAGVASFATPTVNKAFAGYTLVASSGTLAPATTAAFNITAAAATALVITTQPVSSAAGAPLSVVVTAQDAAGNVATGFAGSVTMALGTTTGGAVLAGTASVNAVAGVATFTTLSVNKVFAGYTLVASSGALTPATTTAFNIAASAAATLVVTTQPVSSAAGAPLSIVVTAQDAAGNVATGFTGAVTMALGTTTGGAVLAGTASVNAVAGVATFTTLSVNKVFAGYTLVASSGALTPATTTAFNITASAAASLVVTAQPQNALGGAILAPVTVTAEDASGNVVTSFIGAVTLTLGTTTSGAVLGGTASVSAVAGVATFSTLTVNKRFNGYTLVASATGLANATTTAFNIATGPATTIVSAGGTGQTGTVNLALPTPIAVRVTDAGGNGVLGTTVNFTTADGTVSQPSVATDSSGTAAVIWTLGSRVSPPADSMTATVNGLANSPLTITATGTAVVAGPATKLVFSVEPSNAAAGVANAPAIVVQALDVNNLLATSFTGNVTLAIGTNVGNSTIGGTVTVAAVAGVATFSTITLNKAGAGYTLVASATLLTSPTSTTFNITAGTAANLVKVTGDAQSGTAGQALGAPLVVQVTDALGNAVPNTNVTFAVSTGAGLLNGLASPAVVATNGSGQATVSWTLGVAVGQQSVTATSTGLAGSPVTFLATAAAGSATKLTFSTQPSNAAAGVANAPAIVVQALDVNSLLATSFTGNVTLAIGTNPGTSTIGGTVTVAAVAGVATFSTVTLNKVGTGYTLVASGTALTSATSGAFNITAGAAANLGKVTGDNQAGSAGTALVTPLTMQVTDAFGNVVSGTTVNFAIATGGGSLNPTTTTSSVTGAASSIWTLGPGAGTQTVTVTSAGLAGSPVTFSATSSLPGQRVWTGAAQDNSWTDATNWAPVGAPVSTDSIVVPAVASLPILSGAATVKALTLASGGTLGMNGATLTVTSSLDATGGIVLAGSASSVTLTSGTGANVKGVLSVPLTVQGTYTVSGPLSASSLTVSNAGSLDLHGQNAIIGAGGLTTAGTGTITMTNSLSNLSTTGPATFGGGDETNKLTAGTLAVGGNFAQTGANSLASFNMGIASTLTFVLNGTAATTLSMANPANSLIGNVLVADAAGVTATTGFIVNNLTLSSGTLSGTLGGTINGTLSDPLGLWAAGNISFATSASPVSSNTPSITPASQITFNNAAALLGDLTVHGAVIAAGNLTVNGHNLTILGDFATSGSGQLTMTNAADVVNITGNATFGSTGVGGTMNTGNLNLGGNFTQSGALQSFIASGTHTTVFLGAGTQTATFSSPDTTFAGGACAVNACFQNVVVNKSTGQLNFLSAAKMQGNFSNNSTGTIQTPASHGYFIVEGNASFGQNGTFTHAGIGGSTFSKATSVIDSVTYFGAGQAYNPATLGETYTGIRGTASWTTPGTLAGTMIVDGNGQISVTNGSAPAVITGNFATAGNGTLKMTGSPSDTLTIGGIASFGGGATTGLLTTGNIVIGGASIAVNGLAFDPSGTQTTTFNATSGTQTLGWTSPTPGHGYNNLTLRGGAQRQFGASQYVNGNMLIGATSGNVNGSWVLTFAGNITDSTANHNAWNGSSGIVLTGTPTVLPRNFGVNSVTFSGGTVSLNDSLKTSAHIVVDGATSHLKLNGHYLGLISDFTTQNGGVLEMTNAHDSLDVGGSVTFNGGNTSGLLTHGYINMGGAFNQGVNASAFVADSTLRLSIGRGNGTQITFANPGFGSSLSHFGELMIGDGSTHTLNSDVFVQGQLTTNSLGGPQFPVTGGNHLITAQGANATHLFLTNARLLLVDGSPVTTLTDLQFLSMDPTVTQFEIQRSGTTGTGDFAATLNAPKFNTAPSSGLYMKATDTDGAAPFLTINVSSPTPIITGGFASVVSGAIINGWTAAATWLGVTSDWNTASNWNTGVVPTATTDVLLGCDCTAPQTSAAAAVHNMTMNGTGIQLTLPTGFPLTVNGNLSIASGSDINPAGANVTVMGNVTTDTTTGGLAGVLCGTGGTGAILAGTGTQNVYGKFCRLTVSSNVTATGPILVKNTVAGDGGLTIGTGGNVTFNGHRVETDSLTTTGTGTITMTNPSDSLVANQLYFNGGSTSGKLTAGGINLTGTLAGAIYQGFSGQHVAAAGASATAFAATGTRVWLNAPGSTLMEFANPGSGGSGSHFGFVEATNGAPVSMLTNVFVDSLLVGPNIGSTWQSDSFFVGAVRTITTNGISNVGDTMTLNAVNLVLNDGVASTANLLTWTGFTGYTGALFTQNRSTTTGALLDQNNFSLVTFGTGGLYINNIGTAGLTLGPNNVGPFGSVCSASLPGGTSCAPPPP